MLVDSEEVFINQCLATFPKPSLVLFAIHDIMACSSLVLCLFSGEGVGACISALYGRTYLTN